MTITIEDSSLAQLDLILSLLREHGIGVEKVAVAETPKPSISWAEGDVTELFGVWQDEPRTLEGIRKKAWRSPWQE
ncbi:MAG: hypothetical protein AAFN92_03675 [Bacteroidota bacterium]